MEELPLLTRLGLTDKHMEQISKSSRLWAAAFCCFLFIRK